MKNKQSNKIKPRTIARLLLGMPLNYAIDFIKVFKTKHNPVEFSALVNSIFDEYHNEMAVG